MESEPSLTLEEAIARWRTPLERAQALDAESLAELEAHLRDAVAEATARGVPLHLAFSEAASRLGQFDTLRHEFSKLTNRTSAAHSAMNIRSVLSAPRARRIYRKVLIAAAIALPLRAFAIAPYRVVSSCVAPEILADSHVLVWMAGPHFAPGDFAIFREGDLKFIGRVKAVSDESLTIERASEPDRIVPRRLIVGRVILCTR